MIDQWVKKAQAGEPVWIGAVREACKKSPDSMQLTLRLTTLSGEQRDFPCPLPRWKTPEERKFALDCLSAGVYNLLSALGGKQLEYCYDPEQTELTELICEAKQRLLPDSPGYGRITREVERIDRMAGRDDPDTGKQPDETLPEFLRGVTERSLAGVRAGIDVGGTDIKCAVSVDGELKATLEYDWNPAQFRFASQLNGPILELAKELLDKAGADRFDGIGLSFPDVVIGNRICGGETPKTGGMRAEKSPDYEQQCAEIRGLNEQLETLCRPGVRVRCANDGFVAAFSSGVELAYSEHPEQIEQGVFSHALGTSMGSGALNSDGTFPPIPLEFYDSVIDVGSWTSRTLDPGDLRSTCSGSGLQSVDRYVGQASAFRYAYEIDPALLDGFLEERDGLLRIKSEPKDLRKPCLEHLMKEAENGNRNAEAVFVRIGEAFGIISREVLFYMHPETALRHIFGRFVKYPHVFEQLNAGFRKILPELQLIPADDGLAFSPLMVQLARRKDITVAQFGQAIGAVYLSAK